MNKKVFIRQDGTIPGHRIIEELERRGGINDYALNGDNIQKPYYFTDKGNAIINELHKPSYAPDCNELLYDKDTDSFFEKSQRMVSAEAKEALLPDKFIGVDVAMEGEDVTVLTIPEGFEATIEDGKVIVRKKWTIQDAKPGDIICSPNGSTHDMTLIFKGWEDSSYTFVSAYAGTDIAGKLQVTDGHWLINKESRLATQKEKDYLFQKIDEAGYEWDAEKLELRKKKWQPKEGDAFYFVAEVGFLEFEIQSAGWKCQAYTWWEPDEEETERWANECDYLLKRNNIFQTKEEAQAFCDRLNDAIKPIFEERRKEVE